MTIDLEALRIELGTSPRYDSVVRLGRNRELLALLDEDEAGQNTFLVVNSEEVLEAIGDGLETLTAAVAVEKLRLLTARQTVDFNKQAIRGQLRGIFAGNQLVLDRLQAVGSRTATHAERFGGKVSLRNLWALLKDIPKSYMATKMAEG